MLSPKNVVGLLDVLIAVAVGGQSESVLAVGVAPERVVGGVDDAVLVVVAGQVELLLDPGDGRVILGRDRGTRRSEDHEHWQRVRQSCHPQSHREQIDAVGR